LAKQTDKFSGADIQVLLDRAAEKVLEEILLSGKERLVTERDIQEVLKLTRPSTLERLGSAKDYAEFTNTTRQYDELKAYLAKNVSTKRRIGF
jgi:SpoVK/Ycf46/Vps4 family AAA+-type ATPase